MCEEEPKLADLFSKTKGYGRLRSEYTDLKMEVEGKKEKTRVSTEIMILLERFEYWTVRHCGSLEEVVLEETKYSLEELKDSNHQQKLSLGWFFKPIPEIKEYSFLPVCRHTIIRCLNRMEYNNWIVKRPSEIRKYGNVNDYRLIFKNIAVDLYNEGSNYPFDEETHDKIT